MRGAGKVGVIAAAILLILVCVPAAAFPPPCAGTGTCPVTTDDSRLDFHRYGAAPADDTGAAWGVQTYPIADLDGDGIGEIATTLEPHYTPDGKRQVVVSFGGHSASNALTDDVAMHIVGGGARRFQPAFSVADTNGDGIDEIGACNGTNLAIVFGRIDGGTVDLDHLGSQGFELTDGLPPYLSVFGPSGSCPALSPGDINGDGRGDLVLTNFQDHTLIAFFTPPAAAGNTYEVAGAGADRALVQLQEYDRFVKFEGAGDLDGDGRDDVVVYSHNPDGFGHAVALMDLHPGGTGSLDGIAAGNHGFEIRYETGYTGQDSQYYEGYVAGDVNGDGRRDLTLRVSAGTCDSAVVFSPARGTSLNIAGQLVPGQAKCTNFGIAENAGDIDGDGLDDLYNYGHTLKTDGGDMNNPSADSWSQGSGRAQRLYTQFTSIDPIDDVNGDGVRDELALHSDTSPFDGSPNHYYVSTFLSQADLKIQTETPLRNLFGYTFRASVPDTPESRRVLGSSGELVAGMEIRREGAPYGFFGIGAYEVAANALDPGRIPVGYPGSDDLFAHPELYRFRMFIDTGPGDKPGAHGEWMNLGDWIAGGDRPRPHKVNGSKHADKLHGTKRVDWIRGREGKDKIVGRSLSDSIDGGPGRDVLRGSSGDDVIVGGPGRDVIKCGAGQDTVQRDPQDRMVGCEVVTNLFGTDAVSP